MPGQDVVIDNSTPEFKAYLSLPPSGHGPGLVVLQEIFGVNAVMRGICDQFAHAGFVTFCPDLFWRIQPGIQITDKSDAELQQAFKLYGDYDVDAGMGDIAQAIEVLRERPECDGRVGAIGYCLGGYLAFLTACRTSADASVGYYGVGIENSLHEANDLDRPLMLHIAERDQFVPPDAQARIHATFDDHDTIVLHDYAGMEHAFARTEGLHFDKASAALANTRTVEFLRKHLA